MSRYERVIKGLTACSIQRKCGGCPYEPEVATADCIDAILHDALDLLKMHEPRVLTLEELEARDGAFLIESAWPDGTIKTYWAFWHATYELYDDTVCRMMDIYGELDDRFAKLYGSTWRCWSARPTDEQREAELWGK